MNGGFRQTCSEQGMIRSAAIRDTGGSSPDRPAGATPETLRRGAPVTDSQAMNSIQAVSTAHIGPVMDIKSAVAVAAVAKGIEAQKAAGLALVALIDPNLGATIDVRA
jgi:hypothetical protein